MAPEVYDKVRGQILPHVFRAYLIGLGEPLFSPMFPRMMEDCIRLGVRFNYTTNGLLLDANIAEKTVKHGFGITLSVDGATKETFESIRKGIAFDTLLEKMDIIKFAINKVKPPDFKYCWNIVGMKRNVTEFSDYIVLAAANGVNSITVFNFGVSGRTDDIARESLSLHPELVKKYFPEAIKVAQQHNIELILPTYHFNDTEGGNESDAQSAEPSEVHTDRLWALPEGERFPNPIVQRCYSPWYHLYIRSDGDIWPCCMYATYSLGSLRNQDFKEIWNGNRYQEFRRRIHSGNPAYWCARCNLPWGITGGDENYFYRHKKF
jgi:radical SAM protein with 4Fe4S-binding SPASM domain